MKFTFKLPAITHNRQAYKHGLCYIIENINVFVYMQQLICSQLRDKISEPDLSFQSTQNPFSWAPNVK